MSMSRRIEPFHLDVLKEVGNIGAGHAATALSSLLDKDIDMKVPQVKLEPFHMFGNMFREDMENVAAIYFRIDGEVTGSMFFMLPVKEANSFVQKLTGDTSQKITVSNTTELAVSALSEAGNILAGSYLTALADFTRLNLIPSPPGFAVDMASAILSYALVPLSAAADEALIIETEIIENDRESNKVLNGYFFFLPDPGSLGKILQSLGVPADE
nr:chemotaxis protein CheC [Evansella clarkii]